MLSPVNRDILKRIGFVAWLDVGVDEIIERTSRSANRPLLNTENRYQVIADLCAKRRPLYEAAAHICIETGQLDVLSVVDVVHAAASEFFSHTVN